MQEDKNQTIESAEGNTSSFEAFVGSTGTAEGVAFSSLEPGTILTVDTRNTRYEIIVVDPIERRALVRGGTTFPERTEAIIAGSTAGGTAIKIGWIGVGLSLEMSAGSRLITTSRVRSVIVRRFPIESIPRAA